MPIQPSSSLRGGWGAILDCGVWAVVGSPWNISLAPWNVNILSTYTTSVMVTLWSCKVGLEDFSTVVKIRSDFVCTYCIIKSWKWEESQGWEPEKSSFSSTKGLLTPGRVTRVLIANGCSAKSLNVFQALLAREKLLKVNSSWIFCLHRVGLGRQKTTEKKQGRFSYLLNLSSEELEFCIHRWVQILVLLVTGSVTLGEFPVISKQFPKCWCVWHIFLKSLW